MLKGAQATCLVASSADALCVRPGWFSFLYLMLISCFLFVDTPPTRDACLHQASLHGGFTLEEKLYLNILHTLDRASLIIHTCNRFATPLY